MFAELLAAHGVEERLVLRSRVGFMAFHGGSLERMTDVIAEAAAEPAGASFYAVVQPDDLRWHVPSKFIDPAASPSLTAFLDHVDVAIALHGYGRDDQVCGRGLRRVRHVRQVGPAQVTIAQADHSPASLFPQHFHRPAVEHLTDLLSQP